VSPADWRHFVRLFVSVEVALRYRVKAKVRSVGGGGATRKKNTEKGRKNIDVHVRLSVFFLVEMRKRSRSAFVKMSKKTFRKTRSLLAV